MFKGANQPSAKKISSATPGSANRKRRSSGVHPILADEPIHTYGETPVQDYSVSKELIQILQTQYKNFLVIQQKAGTGPLTRWEAKQAERTKYIDRIDLHLENLKARPSIEQWEQLLMLFVNYRIKLYLENQPFSKSQSTFGDALRAVQMHLLQTLGMLFTKNPSSHILKGLLVDAKTRAITACNSINMGDPVHAEEIKKRAAAFGDHEALRSYAPGLADESRQVIDLAFRLGPVPESSLINGSLFRGKRKSNDEIVSGSPKKSRRNSNI